MSNSRSKMRFSGFLLEIFSIFLGVTIAFLVNHWNELRKERLTERKILTELLNELKADKVDMALNLRGHNLGIRAIDIFERYCRGEEVSLDSAGVYFQRLYRDYITVMHTTAYDALKSRGVDVVRNEELRSQIVQLYDFNYEILLKLEEQYYPAQFHQNYFLILTDHFGKYLEFNDQSLKSLKSYDRPLDSKILVVFNEIRSWRSMLIDVYEKTIEEIERLEEQIKVELEGQ